MEIAGLVIGVGSLAGLASNVVDALGYIRVARSFGDDFGRAQLKLDLAGLRLSRWLEAISRRQDAGASPPSAAEVDLATRILGQISALLEQARETSSRFTPTIAAQGQPEVYQEIDLPQRVKSMHDRILSIAKQRQKKTSVSKKIAWAVRGKTHLDGLLTDWIISSGLETAITPAPQTLQQMCWAEIEEIQIEDQSSDESLHLLSDASSVQDVVIDEAISEVLRKRQGHVYKNTRIDENARLQQGHQILGNYTSATSAAQLALASNTYEDTTVSGTARVMQGDIYGGASFWD